MNVWRFERVTENQEKKPGRKRSGLPAEAAAVD